MRPAAVKPSAGNDGAAGAKAGAESAEVRKVSIHAGSRAAGECGRSAEKVRNLSLSCLSAASDPRPAAPAPLPALDAAPSLVSTRAEKRREESPAAAPCTGGGPLMPEATPYVAGRYRSTRNWCVTHGGELVAVVTYRKGAAELVRRLNSAHGAGVAA